MNDVRRINDTYNANYLRAEYNFVSASAGMAVKWEEFAQDGDRYNLKYRTQKDDRVRPEHASLDGVTLPPSDFFGEECYPPNAMSSPLTKSPKWVETLSMHLVISYPEFVSRIITWK